ncbi:UNVERIFIED_ORG: hypothetical protein J2W66_002881 [Agrobacterium larrymoorei]|nr:hypothetical protein [Agrobacterium larrymoorei]
MCDLGLILGAATTMIGMQGAKQEAESSAAASEYNAKVADMNARLSERRARDSLERGKLDEQQKRNENAQIMGRQKAAMAANGVDLAFGSPLDTLVDTATLGEIDALTIRRNAANEAYDHDVAAANGRADASLNRANAKNTRSAGKLKAAGIFLSGAGKAFGQASDLGYFGKTK